MESQEGTALDVRTRAPRSRWRGLWIVGLTFYLAVLWWVGWDGLRDAVASIDASALAAVVFLLAAAQWLRALKWLYALGRGRGAIGAHFLSKAAGEWSPGRVGEYAPLLVPGHRNARVAAWITVDRLLEIAGTLILAVIGIVGLGMRNGAFMAVTALAMLAGTVLVFVVLARQATFERIAAKQPEGSRRRRLADIVSRVSAEVRLTWPGLPVTGAMTVAACLLDLAVGYYLWVCFGYPLGFFLLAAAKGLHAVVSAVPILPNATGVPYLSVAVLVHEAGGVPEAVLAAGIGLSIILTQFVFWSSFGLASLDFRGGHRSPAR